MTGDAQPLTESGIVSFLRPALSSLLGVRRGHEMHGEGSSSCNHRATIMQPPCNQGLPCLFLAAVRFRTGQEGGQFLDGASLVVKADVGVPRRQVRGAVAGQLLK